MDNSKYWDNFYKGHQSMGPSSFAREVSPLILGRAVDLGAGDGRDVMYFVRDCGINIFGIDVSSETPLVKKQDIREFMVENESPDYVYTRFFWHAIDRETQLAILKWTKKWLFIEARTTEDAKLPKHFQQHERNYVNVPDLVKDIKDNGFQIVSFKEGRGMSKYEEEDPYLVRVVACK